MSAVVSKKRKSEASQVKMLVETKVDRIFGWRTFHSLESAPSTAAPEGATQYAWLIKTV